MKKFALFLLTVLTICVVIPSCGSGEKETGEKIVSERHDSISIAELMKKQKQTVLRPKNELNTKERK